MANSGDRQVRFKSWSRFSSKNLHDCCDVSSKPVIYVPVNPKTAHSQFAHFPVLSYFEKIAHMSVVWAYISLWLCIFVYSDVCCKSQQCWRYYELMLRNQWDLGIYLNMALVKVEQGHFETAILILHNFFLFYYGYRCLEEITLNIFMIQTLCTVMQLFKGSYFSVDAASRHFWPNSAIANGETHVFMSSVSPTSR